MSSPVVYTEGMLFKRQRGLRQGNAKKLKFQERFCRLTSTSLDYFDPHPKKRSEGPKGQFAVEQIKIVEAMEKDIFGKEFSSAFQIGDNTEIMYFVAKTEQEMLEWLKACRHVAQDAGNILLTYHHHGVFGLINKGRWSCCANPRRGCPGCSKSTELEVTQKFEFEGTSITPPTKGNVKSTIVPTSQCPRIDGIDNTLSYTLGPDLDLVSMNDSDNEEFVPPPKIRRFTLADPLMMTPAVSKRLSEIWRGNDEKEDVLLEGETEDELEMKGKENMCSSRGNMPKKNSVIEKKEADTQKEWQDKQHKIELTNDDRSRSIMEASELDSEVCVLVAKKDGGKPDNVDVEELKRLAESRRSNSSSPSIDSGRGASRPHSQTEVADLRVHRAESLTKESLPTEVSNENKQLTFRKKSILEETDSSSYSEDSKIENISKKSEDDLSLQLDKDNNRPSNKDDKTAMAVPKNRKISSPPADTNAAIGQEFIKLRQRSIVPQGYRPTTSICQSADSKSAIRNTLVHMVSCSSNVDRPRSNMLKMPSVYMVDQHFHVYNSLHQACKDGNLDMLKEELNKGMIIDLDEPSNGVTPYTALFIAYINDHYQTIVTLLEHGANPNTVEPKENSCLLQCACEKGALEVVDLLIKYKADVNKRDNSGNTSLIVACKNGHLDVVELLLESGTKVDVDNASQRTGLHEATEGNHVDVIELLLKQSEADPAFHDSNENSAYDIAYTNKNEEIMLMLQLALPKDIRPYSLISANSAAASQMITSIAFNNLDSIITGSRDCRVNFFSVMDLSETKCLTLSDTVLDISIYGSSHLILGSTSIQLVDIEFPEKRRTIADDLQEDESLIDPPLHLSQFGPKGEMATASVENNIVKLWPQVPHTSSHDTQPECRLLVGDSDTNGCVYSLSVSPDPNNPWLAVGLQPGQMLKPDGIKLVYVYDWNSRKLHHIFDAGDGGLGVGVSTEFSPDGKQLAIGCSEHLCIWGTKTGDLLQKYTITNQATINCLCYSPDGAHLAVGLDSGQVQVFRIICSMSIFFLPATSCPSPVTTVSFSNCGKRFASGYKNGTLRLWEAYSGQAAATTT